MIQNKLIVSLLAILVLAAVGLAYYAGTQNTATPVAIEDQFENKGTAEITGGQIEGSQDSTSTPTTTKPVVKSPTTKTTPKLPVVKNIPVNVPTNVNIDLFEKNNSGVSGRATIATVPDGKLKSTIVVMGSSAGQVMPASIRIGRCSAPGTIKYLLSSTAVGGSDTILPTSMATMRGDLPLSIVIHKSTTDANTVAACGEIMI